MLNALTISLYLFFTTSLFIVGIYLTKTIRVKKVNNLLKVIWLTSATPNSDFKDQGLNSCLLHWRVDSLPLSHNKHSRIGEKWSGVQITHKEPWDYLTWITSCNEISSHRCNSKILHSILFPQTFFLWISSTYERHVVFGNNKCPVWCLREKPVTYQFSVLNSGGGGRPGLGGEKLPKILAFRILEFNLGWYLGQEGQPLHYCLPFPYVSHPFNTFML